MVKVEKCNNVQLFDSIGIRQKITREINKDNKKITYIWKQLSYYYKVGWSSNIITKRRVLLSTVSLGNLCKINESNCIYLQLFLLQSGDLSGSYFSSNNLMIACYLP